MKKIYVLFLTAAIYSGVSAQQIEFRLLPEDASRLFDVNNNGTALFPRGYYDYATQTTIPGEAGVQATNRISNLGDVAGEMSYMVGEDNLGQAAYRKGGVWTPIGYFPGDTPGNSWFSSAKAISDNSKYVTGQISVGASGSYPFIYNTETNILTKLTDGDDLWEYGRGQGINDAGYVAGFVDREDFYNAGTFWMPSYFDPTGNLHYIDYDGGTNPENGEAADINNAGLIVGSKGYKPFTYDINTGEFKSFALPSGFAIGSFTSVSENGIALGFVGEFPYREAIVYHPTLGNNPVFLKDIFANNNISIGTYDGRLGTGMGISPDGNWVSGFGNVEGAPFFSKGWIANFNGLLLDDNDCKVIVPENMVTAITNSNQTEVVVNYDISTSCQASSLQGLSVVMIKGLASGSAFPLGNTEIVYHLVDTFGKIYYIASFTVTVNDLYCTSVPVWGGGTYDSITKVGYAGIDNSSTKGSGLTSEYFLDKVAEVKQGETQTFNLEAYTSGAIEKVSAFIDWNQNGLFTDAGEMYEIGTATSTYDDNWNEIPANISADITTPIGAPIGTTRMRVVLKYGNTEAYVTDPCDNTEAGDYMMGQSEDYMVDVKEYLATDNSIAKSFSYYPNPVTDILSIIADNNISSISVYSIDGKLMLTQAYQANEIKLDLSKLKTGMYMVKANLNDGAQKNIKVIKK